MEDGSALIALIETYSLAILLPLAVVEGPVVSVLAGYLAAQGLVGAGAAGTILVLADLAGDALLYLVGRRSRSIAPDGILSRLGVTRRRLARVVRRFRRDGLRYLLVGKLTHSAVFAVLIAAGAARVPPLSFFAVNLAATIPKTGALLALGWFLGAAWQSADSLLPKLGMAGLALFALFILILFWKRHKEPA